MSGRHGPSTNRSFYLSLATSTLRFAIVIALVVGGVVLINQAFPDGGASPLPSASGGSPPASPSSGVSPKETPKTKPTPVVVGVKIGVFNGAGVTGLAGDTANLLQRKYGYDPVQVADAPSQVSQTTLYFRTATDKVEAQEMARVFFRGLDVKIAKLQSGTDVQKDVQVAVYLGTDYAQLQQG